MTAHVQDEAVEPDRVVIAQAEGILAARHRLGMTEATAALRSDARTRDVPIVRLAEDLVRRTRDPRPGPVPRPPRGARPPQAELPDTAVVCPELDRDLDEERELQDGIRRRRPAPPDLDAATEAVLRAFLTPEP
jgi:hypothetical protein